MNTLCSAAGVMLLMIAAGFAVGMAAAALTGRVLDRYLP